MKKVLLFLILSIVFSALVACNNSPKTQNNQIGETNQPADNGAPTNVEKKGNDEYPRIPSAIAQTEIKKIDGTSFKIEDKKGKVVLVNLWATWCGPCRGEMPHLVEMQEKFADKGFEIVGLDVDPEPVEDINNFAKQMKLNYQLGWADRDLYIEFDRISKSGGRIPQSFLIDRDNRLRGVFLGGGSKVLNTMKETVEKVVSE